MLKRLRTTSFAGFGAILLALIVSGMVAAASLLTAIAAPEPDQVGPAVVDTTQTFEDANGNGIDDDCETGVVADETAAAAADAAVDLNADGTVSVSEAAQSDRTGGTNCNHGGYVSQVAHETCGTATDTGSTDVGTADGDQAGEPADTETNADETSTNGSDESDSTEAVDAEAPESDCTTTDPTTQVEAPTQDGAPTCDTAPTNADTSTDTTEPTDTETTDTPKNHGAVVSVVAHSDAVGGKNCNHGGAVSEASHKDNEARKAARDAEKAARNAARDAAKAARDAAHSAKHAGKGHGH